MIEIEREFRPKQKGVECSIEGCAGWCVSNDLCAKHSMQRYRATEKGRAYVREYNKRYKRPDINKICGLCKIEFVTARVEQWLCGECSGSGKANYLTQKRNRNNNRVKVRVRDIVNKRIGCDVGMQEAS